MNAAERKRIARALLSYIPPPRQPTRPKRPDLSPWQGFPAPAARFVESNPNAFLFGALFDRMVVANTAWQAPYHLSRRLGHFDLRRIAAMRPEDLAPYIGRYRGQNALHRFTKTMSAQAVSAARRLTNEYAGSAANIWPAWSSARDVIERLSEFEGISHKIAHMTTRLLVTYYGVPLTGWEDIDVAEDRHVARTFLRAGLVDGRPGKRSFRVSELRDEIIASARALSPSYPGALDEPAFVVGRGWCNAGQAWCGDGEEPCPLLNVCPQSRRGWEII